MTRDLRNDRWTCPNDRNLQLRSKLNAGWSYHTGKKTVLKKDPQLTESELIEIQKVLQRSEMVERNERDRVLKLVERLENMKRNVTQSNQSPNRCSLCGDYFCIIRSMPSHCSFCQKILCSKCCIETQFSDGDPNFNNTHSRRNSITSLCSSNSSKTSVYLCRLCSEQREFLKKSGAWFLKKYPSYISSMSESNGSSSPNLSQMDQNSPYLKPRNIRNRTKQNIYGSSSPNSSSFRLWNKTKESNFQNNDDNISDISNDNELNFNNESNSNFDSNSVRNFSASNENIQPKSVSKENGANQHSPKDTNAHNGSFKRHNQTVNLNQSNELTQLSSPINNQNKTSQNSNSTSTSTNNFSDEEGNSPNMTNYNYYSNIINNLKPDENVNLNQETNISNNGIINNNNNNNNIQNNVKLKNVSFNNISKKNKTGVLELSNNKTIDTIPFGNNNSMTGINNNLEANLALVNKTDSTKSFKKPKLLEWCSSQLSMEKLNPPKFKSSRNKLESEENEKNNDKKFKSFKFINHTSKSQNSSPLPSSKNPAHLNTTANKSNTIENSFIATSSMAALISNQGTSSHNITNSLNKLNLN